MWQGNLHTLLPRGGEIKQDCRRRNIIYESKCLLCNPVDEKGKKDGKELEDKGPFPSIYVGESGRSLHEHAAEHWADFTAKSSDSHILKHWEIHHGGTGSPKFKIGVIKYCRDALSRQVGEAVRISMRGQTLNSKSGCNRSGLSRPVLKDKQEDSLAVTNPISKGLGCNNKRLENWGEKKRRK